VLVAADFTSHLTELSLNNNKIRDVGVKNLSSAQLFDLEDLSLGSPFAIQAITASHPMD
jgi:Leucine-rich repeat (LRR) protein